MTDPLEIAVRAYAEVRAAAPAQQSNPRPLKRQTRRRPVEAARRPDSILVFDTETTTGPEQALLFGCYRFFWLHWTSAGPTLTRVEEGLLYADDLAERDPAGYARLARYARSHPAAVDGRGEDAVSELRLLTRTEFAKDVLWKALSAEATVVGFNLPFDLSRIAVAWAEARSKRYAGGFSLTLFQYERDGQVQENRYRPRVLVRPLDSKRARIGLGRPRRTDPDTKTRNRGAFIDCRTLAYALTGEPHTLESACQTFGIDYQKRQVAHGQISADYIGYCREDVAATAELYQALACDYERWGLQLAPTRAYSPASLAKAYLREAGVRPVLERQPGLPPELLGQALVAYYGGRAECRIRRLPVPVAYLDFASMYPTVCALIGLWRFLACQRVELVEGDPAETEAWLAGLTPDDCFDPAFWPNLCGLALVQPQGDVMPVRARYSPGGSFGIGVNPLRSEEPLWYTLPDLVASILLTGRALKILRCLRIVPRGQARGLRPLQVRGSRPIHPAREDVFRALVEERRRLEALGDPESLRTARALKTVANAASYGIFVELNRQEPKTERTPMRVFGLDSFDSDATAVEEPGEYLFPPLACLATGAGRLMLTLLERHVADAGGAWAFADTDSMAIVATEQGGLVPCPGGRERDERGRECIGSLSWAQVDRIVERFEALNPYDRTLVPGSILELEQENIDPATGARRELHCYAISAKRYALFTLDEAGEPQLVKWSEHALGGFYLNPSDPDSDDRDWVQQAWEWIVREDALGLKATEPAWLDRPALTRFTASHPRLLRPFTAFNAGKLYQEQIKPANFLLVAHVHAGGHPLGADPKRFCLVALYESDPRAWQQLPWRNIYDPAGPGYQITGETLISRGGRPLPPGVVGVKSYRDVLDGYRTHPEPKSLSRDGRPCTRQTLGLLRRRPVQALTITHIGKEANLLDQIQAGLIGDEAQMLAEYVDVQRDAFGIVRSVLDELSLTRIATDSGLDHATVKRIRSGRVQPSARSRALLTSCAGAYAREQLTSLGEEDSNASVERNDLRACARYLAARPARACSVCGTAPKGPRARYCSRTCRDRAYRQRRKNNGLKLPGGA